MPPTYLSTGVLKVQDVVNVVGSTYTYDAFRLQVVHRGGGNDLWWATFDPTTNTWAKDTEFSNGNQSNTAPALAVLNGILYCVHCGNNSNLWWTTFDPTTNTWAQDTQFSNGNQSGAAPALAVYSQYA